MVHANAFKSQVRKHIDHHDDRVRWVVRKAQYHQGPSEALTGLLMQAKWEMTEAGVQTVPILN